MKAEKKSILLQKINLWVFLILKLSIFSISNLKSLTLYLAILIIVVIALLFIQAALRISLDVSLGEMSNATLFFKYICTFSISGIFIYKMYWECKYVFMIITISLLFLEITMIFIIAYRYKILRSLKKLIHIKKIQHKDVNEDIT